MELLGGNRFSQCSEFSQPFSSISQSNVSELSPYQEVNCITQHNQNIVQMCKANPFTDTRIKQEPNESPLNVLFTSGVNSPCTFTPKSSTSNDIAPEKCHPCEVCAKSFSDRSLLQKHKIAHAEAKHICSTCGRAFVREDKLRRHIRSIHSDERPYVCEVCTKAFARKDKLQEHFRHHNRDITFPCPVCHEIFLMRSILNRHLRTNHQMKQNEIHKSAPLKSMTLSGSGESLENKRKCRRRCSTSTTASTTTIASTNSAVLKSTPTAFSNPNPALATANQGGWNAANLLLYNRYQQQQPQQQGQQLDLSWGCPSYFYPPNAYQNQYAAAAMMRQARPDQTPPQQQATSDQQQQQQQYLQSQSSAALSAAMAARLFSPANYVNWWPQAAGQNFVFPQTQVTQTPVAATASNGYFPSLNMSTTDQPQQQEQLSATKETTASGVSPATQQVTYQSPFAPPSERGYTNTAQQQYSSNEESNNSSSQQQQLASLYYRAASLAASQQQQLMTSSPLTTSTSNSQADGGNTFTQLPPAYSS